MNAGQTTALDLPATLALPSALGLSNAMGPALGCGSIFAAICNDVECKVTREWCPVRTLRFRRSGTRAIETSC